MPLTRLSTRTLPVSESVWRANSRRYRSSQDAISHSKNHRERHDASSPAWPFAFLGATAVHHPGACRHYPRAHAYHFPGIRGMTSRRTTTMMNRPGPVKASNAIPVIARARPFMCPPAISSGAIRMSGWRAVPACHCAAPTTPTIHVTACSAMAGRPVAKPASTRPCVKARMSRARQPPGSCTNCCCPTENATPMRSGKTAPSKPRGSL